MSRGMRHFEEEEKDLGYDYVWIIVDDDSFIQIACWSETFRDLYLKDHPTHMAIRYAKIDSTVKTNVENQS